MKALTLFLGGLSMFVGVPMGLASGVFLSAGPEGWLEWAFIVFTALVGTCLTLLGGALILDAGEDT